MIYETDLFRLVKQRQIDQICFSAIGVDFFVDTSEFLGGQKIFFKSKKFHKVTVFQNMCYMYTESNISQLRLFLTRNKGNNV